LTAQLCQRQLLPQMGVHIVEDIAFFDGLPGRLSPLLPQPQEGDHHLRQLVGNVQFSQRIALRTVGLLPQPLQKLPQLLRLTGRALHHRGGSHVLHQSQRRAPGLAQGLHGHVHIVKIVCQQIVLQRLLYHRNVGYLPRQHRHQRPRPHLILPVLQDHGAPSAGKQPEP